MTKNELLTKLSERLGVTKKQVGEYIDIIDEIVDMVAEGEVNDKVKLGKGITLEKVFVEEKSGNCNGKPYISPAHHEILVKRTQSLKRV